jgi:hypothetical protein
MSWQKIGEVHQYTPPKPPAKKTDWLAVWGGIAVVVLIIGALAGG